MSKSETYNPSIGHFVQTPEGKGRVIAIELSRGEPLYIVHRAHHGEKAFNARELCYLPKRAGE